MAATDRTAAGIVVAAMLMLTGCGGARPSACACPHPVAYDEVTLKQISVALRALPPDNVLHRAMEDYENERDDLRFCARAGDYGTSQASQDQRQ